MVPIFKERGLLITCNNCGWVTLKHAGERRLAQCPGKTSQLIRLV